MVSMTRRSSDQPVASTLRLTDSKPPALTRGFGNPNKSHAVGCVVVVVVLVGTDTPHMT